MNTYTKHEIRNNKFIRIRCEEIEFPVIELKGDAIITAVGGNGRFEFILNGNTYKTEFTKNIARGIDGYYNYTKIVFNINITEEWSKLYIHNPDKNNY